MAWLITQLFVPVVGHYGYGCGRAVIGERTLPVLEAAHIKPFSLVEKHEIANGPTPQV